MQERALHKGISTTPLVKIEVAYIGLGGSNSILKADVNFPWTFLSSVPTA